jgi:hypothetical protein
MSLHVLAYNLTRIISILGVHSLLEAITGPDQPLIAHLGEQLPGGCKYVSTQPRSRVVLGPG